MDLQSEIEARKSRIAELKRQREALASRSLQQPSYTTKQTARTPVLTHVGFPGPQIEVEAPFIYTKTIQTDQLVLEETSSPIEPVQDSSVELKPETSAPAFTLADPQHFERLPPSLVAFIDDSWRSVARSLSGAAALRNYATNSVSSQVNAGNSGVQGQSSLILHSQSLAGQSVIAWFPQFGDLIVARSADPRKAHIWSLDAPEQPEYVLKSPTIITQLLVSPHTASIVYAGGANGQILAWDLKERVRNGGTRFDILPTLKSGIENSKIIALNMIGTNLVSLNEDGILHVWAADLLSQPRHTVNLEDKFRPVFTSLKLLSGMIVPTAMANYSALDSSYGLGYGVGTCVIGSIQGNLFRLPVMPTSQPRPFVWKHAAPVTSLQFRPQPAPPTETGRKQGSLLLSSGMDWSIRLWFVPHEETETPVLLQTFSTDYIVSAVVWRSRSMFAAMGETKLQVWDLNRSIVKPILSFATQSEATMGCFNDSQLAVVTQSQIVVHKLADEEDTDAWLLQNHHYMNI